MSMALERAFEARNPSAVDVGSLLREMRLALRETCEVGRRAWRGEWDVLLGKWGRRRRRQSRAGSGLLLRLRPADPTANCTVID